MTRETLRVPFHAQCYAAAPVALAFSISATLVRTVVFELHLLAGVLSLAGVAWFVAVETAWFRRVHHQALGQALGNAVRAYVEGAAIL